MGGRISGDFGAHGTRVRNRRATVASVAGWVVIAVLASGTAFGAQGASVPGSSVSPRNWWGTVCSELSAYTKDTAKFGNTLVEALKDAKSPSDARASLIKFLNNNVSRADKLITSLRKAGSPNAPNGAQFASATQAGIAQLRDGLQGLLPEAKAAPTSSTAAMQSAITTLQTNVSAVGSQSGNAERAAQQLLSPSMLAARQATKSCNSVNQ
jgi:hypothetical protein